MKSFLSAISNAIPFVFPALGGAAGVIYLNLNKMDQPNPMYWIGGGIILGFVAARLVGNLLARLE